MYTEHPFEDFCKIDTTRIEYINLKQSLLAINWELEAWIISNRLSYSRGFNFTWLISNGIKIVKPTTDCIPVSIEQARIDAIPFFNYLDSLVPNHRVFRAEILYTPPEKVDKRSELERMHIDCKTLHKYLKRCQLAIVPNPDGFLFVEDDCAVMKTDTLIHFNNRKVHWGVNWGVIPKLNMTIEFIDLDVWNSLSNDIKKVFYLPAEDIQDDLLKVEFYKSKFRETHRGYDLSSKS
jgi:hypothetical protein